MQKGNINFSKWTQCWSRYKDQDTSREMDPSEESCYQSTLIIPITLLNNEDLSPRFRERFKFPTGFIS